MYSVSTLFFYKMIKILNIHPQLWPPPYFIPFFNFFYKRDLNEGYIFVCHPKQKCEGRLLHRMRQIEAIERDGEWWPYNP